MITFRDWLLESYPVANLIGFHKTTKENAAAIMQQGFDLSKARKYELGLGVYLSLKPKTVISKVTGQEVNIQCDIKNSDKFLVIPENMLTPQRFAYMRKKFPSLPETWIQELSNVYFKGGENEQIKRDLIPFIMNNFRGLVVPGINIIVAYNAQDVIPIRIVS